MLARWRIGVIALLVAAPMTFLAGVAFYALWLWGVGFWAWWPMFACFSLAWFLAWWWTRKRLLLPPVDMNPPMHWTERDKEAWKIVEARAGVVLTREQLTDLATYHDSAADLALEIARFYQPKANDPFGRLTVPEILAVVELASQDLTQLVATYVPGSHLLTIDQWKSTTQLVDWFQKANNLYWVISGIFAPLETAAKYIASRATTDKTMSGVQTGIQQWFYAAYVQRIGHYLVELHSGRLKVGAKRYRELTAPSVATAAEPPVTTAGTAPAEPTPSRQVTLTLMGQVKAGKSSTANALLGEQRAITDVLPATSEITRYRLRSPGLPTELDILDTVGYGHEGPRADQLKATTEAAQQSDALLLVLHATNPGRLADMQLLDRMREWFASRPDLKMPPIVGVVTHIDLLSPAKEWAPPYNWVEPTRPKEHTIARALAAVREQFGGRLADVVPVCVVPGKEFGVKEALLPAVSSQLDEAHAVGLLRVLWAEANTGRVRKVWSQLLAGGREAIQLLLTHGLKTPADPDARRPA